MSDVAEKDARLLESVRRSQKPLLVLGALVALAGAAYLVWAVLRFDPNVDPRRDPGFDRPVAQLAFLFDHYQKRIDAFQIRTPTERHLLYGLSRNMEFSAGIMVLLVRMLLGTLALVFGFSIVTIVVERARLLAILGRRQQ